jgi:hypothetical protein
LHGLGLHPWNESKARNDYYNEINYLDMLPFIHYFLIAIVSIAISEQQETSSTPNDPASPTETTLIDFSNSRQQFVADRERQCDGRHLEELL